MHPNADTAVRCMAWVGPEPALRRAMEAAARDAAEPFVQRIADIWMIHSTMKLRGRWGGPWDVEQQLPTEWQREVELIRREMEVVVNAAIEAAKGPTDPSSATKASREEAP